MRSATSVLSARRAKNGASGPTLCAGGLPLSSQRCVAPKRRYAGAMKKGPGKLFWALGRRLVRRPNAVGQNSTQAGQLEEGWELFSSAFSDAHTYAEWGSGSSTVWVNRMTECVGQVAETDAAWAKISDDATNDRINVLHIDLGPVGDWGRPLSYDRSDSFQDYLSAPFRGGFSPDVVLIDGRFRVACFLSALLHTKPGAKIIFDDYVNRPHYHVVEQILRPMKTNERQAQFVRPTQLDEKAVAKLLSNFMFVMD